MQDTKQTTIAQKNWIQKLVASPYFWIAFVAIGFSIPFIRTYQKSVQMEPLPMLGQVDYFDLQDQAGNIVSWEDFQGKVVIANFIFTSCPDVCPFMTQQMATLQGRTGYVREYVRFLSITVDPETDTPDVLTNYARKFGVNFKNWSFLTGPLDSIKRTVTESFKMALEHNDSGGVNFMSIVHGEQFVVIDQMGRIRAYHPSRTKKDLDNILRTVTILVNAPLAAPALTR